MIIYNKIKTIAIINNTVKINPTTIGLGNAARSKDRVFFGAKILFAKLITLDIVYSS